MRRSAGGPEDVRDDELNHFVNRACANPRVNLWVILDCCHSGTGVYGEVHFRRLARSFPPAKNRNIAAAERGRNSGHIICKTIPANAVVLTACRAGELESEYREKDCVYGLLTRFLVQALMDPRAKDEVTYDRLRLSVEHRYLQEGVMSPPTPQLEGHPRTLAGPVFGGAAPEDRGPVWTVERLADREDRVSVRAGRIHGLRPGACASFTPAPRIV